MEGILSREIWARGKSLTMLEAAVNNTAIYPHISVPLPSPPPARALAHGAGWMEGTLSREIWARGKSLSLEYEEGDLLLRLKHVWYA